MLKKVISSSKHFIEYDIWKQKWKFLILFLLTGLYYGVINYYIADNKWLITSIESLKYLGWIYVNIPSLHLNWVKYFLGIFWISIWLVIIYYLYQRTKNFLTLTKGFLFLWITFLFYFYFWGYFSTDYNFISFLPFLAWSGIISSIFIIYLLISLSNWIYLRSSESQLKEELENDTDKPLKFYPNPRNVYEENVNTKNIKKMQDLWYDSIAKNLAKRLKEEIEKDNSPEVIGIEWEWGSGKSSFISLVKYYVYHEEKIHFPLPKFIKESDPNKKWNIHFSWDRNRLYDFFEQKFWSDIPPTFLDFNPWYFESTTNLLDSFFRSLSEHIEEKYHIDTGSTFSKFARSIGSVSEYEILWVKFKRSNTPSSPDYEHQRNNLNQILDSLDNPIMIIIDDLDRVNLEQCKQVFQLIYLCGDLRNVHFLVSYDSEKFNSIDVPTFVTHSKVQKLSNYTEYRSAPITEYIKKIIHEPIIVIPSTLWLKWLIKDYLTKSIEELWENADDLELNNVLYNIFDPEIFPKYQKYLRNPRAIKRLFLFAFWKKWQINKNAGFQKYTMSPKRRILLIKIGILYFEKKELFLDIANEIQLIDEKMRSDKEYYPVDDVKFYPIDIITLNSEDNIEKRKKNLKKYCENLIYGEDIEIIKDIFEDDTLSGNDLKYIVLDYFLHKESVAIIKWRWLFGAIQWTNKELSYLESFSIESAEFYCKIENIINLSVFLIDIQESIFYKNQSLKFKSTIDKSFLDENHWFIVDKVLWYIRNYIRDDGAVSEIWILEFYSQLFTGLKSSDFPIPAQWEKFSETLLGHISDNIWLSVYSLIFWIERRRWYLDMQQLDAQRIIRELFDDVKLFDNWGIFWISYLLRLWSGLSEVKYTSLLMWETTDVNNSNNTKTWIARFIYEVFHKYYITPRKSFLTGNYIIDRYWINFVKYQFMSEKEMWNILLSDSWEEKIGEKVGKYFQDVVYIDSRFSDIWILFQYLIIMSYSYSAEFNGTYLHYSGESDWNTNPFMKNIILHFQSKIDAYILDNPDGELEVNARYDGYEPRKFKISEIWEHLKKVTKLDNPPTE